MLGLRKNSDHLPPWKRECKIDEMISKEIESFSQYCFRKPLQLIIQNVYIKVILRYKVHSLYMFAVMLTHLPTSKFYFRMLIVG